MSKENNLYYKEDFLQFKQVLESSIKSGQFTSAMNHIESVVVHYSDHPGVLGLAGMLYYHIQDYRRAQQFIKQALEFDPTNFEYRLLQAKTFHELHQNPEAIAILQELLSAEPEHPEVLLLLADISFRQKNYSSAVEYAQKVRQLDSQNAESWALLGKALLDGEQSAAEALEHLQRASKLGLKDDELEFYHAKALYKNEEYEPCKKHCRKFMMKNPNSSYNEAFRKLLFLLKNPKPVVDDEPNSPMNSRAETVYHNQGEGNQVQKYQNVFSRIEAELNQEVIGQQEYIAKLCYSFMRPFISSHSLYKSAFFISGRHGQGMELSIRLMGTFLHKEKLLKSKKVSFIDLLSYSETEDGNFLFFSDLYKALYGNSSILVFQNVEKCPTSIISKLTQLLENGRIKLDGRYGYENGNLYRVHGSLLENSFDEIKAKGQFLLFVSNKSFEKVRSIFPQQSLKLMKDQLVVPNLKRSALQEITKRQLNRMKVRLDQEFSLYVRLTDDLASFVINHADLSNGVHGIKSFIQQDIYDVLADLCLKDQIALAQTYNLIPEQDTLVISDGSQQIILLSAKIDKENTEEVKKELDSIIGLSSVKELLKEIEGLLELQRERKARGAKGTRPSLNFIFSGNPGTGKTTVARMLAKYLKAIGFLMSGHLIEVDRSKLVGQYIGDTAPMTQSQIEAAKGGVLFIDEAYSLARGGENDFGREAIDTIVKGIEDYRDDLVVILAGYEKEMEEFLKTNPGLRSRFNHHVVFEDYSSEELYQIAEMIAKGEGYYIENDCKEGLIELFDRKQIKGRNDLGNGRLARNIVEEAITKQSQRLLTMGDYKDLSDDVINTLIANDFGLQEKQTFDLEKELVKIIGLDKVKDFIRILEQQVFADQRRKEAGFQVNNSQTLNMIFTGNPGTGKTTVARILANLLKEMKILKKGQTVEVDRSDLVGEYLGQTAPKTREKFMDALGGVLFIDEAYALSNDQYGKEAIDTLVKLMEDYRENIVIILAGYEKEMGDFLKTNSGLKSRFPLQVHFDDYSVEELKSIGEQIIKGKGFVLDRNASVTLTQKIIQETRISSAEGGNGRLVRNIVEEVIRNQSRRVAMSTDVSIDGMIKIMEEDFGLYASFEKGNQYDLEVELAKIIGLDNVKNFLRELRSQLRIQEQRKKAGLPVGALGTLHMVFKGNPGTGKTTIARIVGELLYQLGVLNKNKVVEVDRSQVVAGYVGQTAIKTREKIEEALGGVLFIDEAYTLVQDANSGSGFGTEAINTILKGMEDHREDLVVILAGYTDEMEEFMKVNPGLSSRFTNKIMFEDYTVHELLEIAKLMYEHNQYFLTKGAVEKLTSIFEIERRKKHFGNGRFVRNVYEDSLRKQAVRLQSIEELSVEDLRTITERDIK